MTPPGDGLVWRQALESYPDQFLSCRDFGHMWKPVTARQITSGRVERVLACDRCESKRTQVLDRQGYILGSSYSYVKHYQVPGTGRMTASNRAELRVASVQRLLD